eukprot:1145456-Pelagomonas_calceolata.AAC.1
MDAIEYVPLMAVATGDKFVRVVNYESRCATMRAVRPWLWPQATNLQQVRFMKYEFSHYETVAVAKADKFEYVVMYESRWATTREMRLWCGHG